MDLIADILFWIIGLVIFFFTLTSTFMSAVENGQKKKKPFEYQVAPDTNSEQTVRVTCELVKETGLVLRRKTGVSKQNGTQHLLKGRNLNMIA